MSNASQETQTKTREFPVAQKIIATK